MNGMLTVAAATGAVGNAAIASSALVRAAVEGYYARKRRDQAKNRFGMQRRFEHQWTMRYLEGLTAKLYAGATKPLSPSVRHNRMWKTRSGAVFEKMRIPSGCRHSVSLAGFCEAGVRLALAMAVAGAFVGLMLSTELALVLATVGALAGKRMPAYELARRCKERGNEAQRCLSEMLEVVALGMRGGLTFDRAFALYGSHFSSGFAQACARANKRWSLGLATREEALHDLASEYECDQLRRTVEALMRDLRLGNALAANMEDAARQARATYKAGLEERVAKAPVKMMLPTGALILPAMLLLVMGPILLELAGGF